MAEQFHYETFVNLMTVSPQRALEYRDRCHNLIKEDKQVKEVKEIKEEIKEVKTDWIELNPDDFTEDEEDEVKTEFTREDLINKLNTAWIKFVASSKDETLLKKCIENNLI